MPAPNGHFLREFGQSDRELVENGSDEATVGQALRLLNGRQFSYLQSPFSVISQNLKHAESPEKMLTVLYRSLYSRDPTVHEREVLGALQDKKKGENRQDALWIALNSPSFYFIQ
jgi:hypothetical protein